MGPNWHLAQVPDGRQPYWIWVTLNFTHDLDPIPTLNTDDDCVTPTKKRKLGIEDKTEVEDDHEDSIDDNDFEDKVDEVSHEKIDNPLSVPTHFTNEFPLTSDMKKPDGINNTSHPRSWSMVMVKVRWTLVDLVRVGGVGSLVDPPVIEPRTSYMYIFKLFKVTYMGLRSSSKSPISNMAVGCCHNMAPSWHLVPDKDGQHELVGYAFRTLPDTEKRYSQIEKEAFALTWCADRFRQYILGLEVTLETDHKPLIQIFQTIHIDNLTPRLQRFCLRLMRYAYSVQYFPGKQLEVADCLSRSPLEERKQEDKEFEHEAKAFVGQIATVKVAKSLLKMNEDISLALLSYRTTPLDCRFSPTEMLMNRRLRSTLPLLPTALEEVLQPWLAHKREHLQKEKQVANYNRRDRVRNLLDLQVGDKSPWTEQLSRDLRKDVQRLRKRWGPPLSSLHTLATLEYTACKKHKTDYYHELLRRLRDVIRREKPEEHASSERQLRHDNAQARSAQLVQQFSAEHKIPQVRHPPHSPDLEIRDFFLSPEIKPHFKGKKIWKCQ
ncbi:hypothetical protein PR048_017925 [Dryococelus australis]|uniref:Reverse transcriptase RNase H-like domain-containing protein n=1 Tax=Dryococelus australis TaxID=614101 RepID=A0ABQ9HAZ8_9NEOP|nr:hypothetical protein PR048_017925 [Dryococelus australis]